MSILELQQQARRLGELRFGAKDQRGVPHSLKTWRLTSPARGLLQQAAELWGGEVREWNGKWEVVTDAVSLPVLVVPQDAADMSWYEMWGSGGLKRRCNGREIVGGEALGDDQEPIACLCPDEDRTCKPVTRVSFALPDIPDIGVWLLTTGSWAVAKEMSFTVMRVVNAMRDTGWMPDGTLRLEPRQIKQAGKPRKDFVVPVLEVGVRFRDLLPASPETPPPLPAPAPVPEDTMVAPDHGAIYPTDGVGDITVRPALEVVADVPIPADDEVHAALFRVLDDEPGAGTIPDIEHRTRFLFNVMDDAGYPKWGDTGMRAAIVAYLERNDLEVPDIVHYSSLGRKEHMQRFAEEAWAAAKLMVPSDD